MTPEQIKILKYASKDKRWENEIFGKSYFKDLWKYFGGGLLNYGAEKYSIVTSLIDEGYCELSRCLVGPLGVDTGEFFLKLTPAGKKYLTSHTN